MHSYLLSFKFKSECSWMSVLVLLTCLCLKKASFYHLHHWIFSFGKFQHYWSSIDPTSGSSLLLIFPKSRIFIYARVKMDSRKMIANGLQHVEQCRCFRERTLLLLPFPSIPEYVFNVIYSSHLKASSCLIVNTQGQMAIVSNYI